MTAQRKRTAIVVRNWCLKSWKTTTKKNAETKKERRMKKKTDGTVTKYYNFCGGKHMAH